MRLYECPRNVQVRVVEEGQTPPDCSSIAEGEIINFHHTDGMYSYCTNQKGEVVHLAAWTEVEIVNG